MRLISIALMALVVAGCGNNGGSDSPKADGASEVAVSKSVPQGWMEDFAAAKAKAKAEGKRMLVVFTDSQNCCWCTRLEKEVLGTVEFLELARPKYVLVMIDLPSDQSRLSELARRQNEPLAREFGINAFPHGIVFDSEGRPVGHIGGYLPGGTAAYFGEMESMGSTKQGERGQ